jgi:hypothetical protein
MMIQEPNSPYLKTARVEIRFWFDGKDKIIMTEIPIPMLEDFLKIDFSVWGG